MAVLKLEVGKTYETVEGERVYISHRASECNRKLGWSFKSNGLRLHYTSDGRASHDIDKRCMDLVKELADSDTELIISVGTIYISRHGKSLKIVEKLGSFFRTEANVFYTREGKVCIPDRREEESWDIIPKSHPGSFWTSSDHTSGD